MKITANWRINDFNNVHQIVFMISCRNSFVLNLGYQDASAADITVYGTKETLP